MKAKGCLLCYYEYFVEKISCDKIVFNCSSTRHKGCWPGFLIKKNSHSQMWKEHKLHISLEGVAIQDLISNSNFMKLLCPELIYQLPNCFEILHRAWQWYCHALCKLSKQLGKWNLCYGQILWHLSLIRVLGRYFIMQHHSGLHRLLLLPMAVPIMVLPPSLSSKPSHPLLSLISSGTVDMNNDWHGHIGGCLEGMESDKINTLKTQLKLLPFCRQIHFLGRNFDHIEWNFTSLVKGLTDNDTGDPLHSRAACTQPCNVNTHSPAHCSPGARLCEQWGHGCVNNGARLCASARLCRGSPVNESYWIRLIAWHQTGNKPLPKLMMT